ncbi:MAG: FHA domain-containing protein [Planctomycetota bacterium]|nr:MAG: FHA domain-containing protein [Planctomycetota bacterium]
MKINLPKLCLNTIQTPISSLKKITISSKSILGRSKEADIVLSDPEVSRQHCCVYPQNKGWYILDLGSHNGTFLNSKKIQRAPLAHGDYLVVGQSHFLVVLEQGERLCCFCGKNAKKFLEVSGSTVCFSCLEDRSKDHSLLKNYAIFYKIGQGGMGDVYLGKHLPSAQEVAIKFILADGKEQIKQSFRREVKTMSKLSHPHIVSFLEADQIEGRLFYFVMEYIPGQTLYHRISHGLPSLNEAKEIMRAILSALQHAYEHKVVHRDVTPFNILLGQNGKIKLTDFGISKFIQGDSIALTEPGEGKGTLDYISPEQMTNALEADHLSDIYSAGATFYHMLAGRPPFKTKYMRDMITMILHKAPLPPSTYNPNLLPEMDAVVLKSLQKDPVDRYQTPQEFWQALEVIFLEGR